MEGIDLTPILDYGIEAVGAVALAVITWFVTDVIGIKRDSDVYQGVMSLIHEAVDDAQRWARRQGQDISDPSTQNAVIDKAADKVLSQAPKWLKKLGWDSDYVASLVRDALP